MNKGGTVSLSVNTVLLRDVRVKMNVPATAMRPLGIVWQIATAVMHAAFLASVRAGVQVPGSAFSIAPEPTPPAEECSEAQLEHAKGGCAAWWTQEEDRRLLYAAYLVGSWNQPSRGSCRWEQGARLVGTRNTRQCRRRWSTAHNAALVSAHNGVRPSWPPARSAEPILRRDIGCAPWGRPLGVPGGSPAARPKRLLRCPCKGSRGPRGAREARGNPGAWPGGAAPHCSFHSTSTCFSGPML